jgi:hypothetical protein
VSLQRSKVRPESFLVADLLIGSLRGSDLQARHKRMLYPLLALLERLLLIFVI